MPFLHEIWTSIIENNTKYLNLDLVKLSLDYKCLQLRMAFQLIGPKQKNQFRYFSLVWMTKAFSLAWLLRLFIPIIKSIKEIDSCTYEFVNNWIMLKKKTFDFTVRKIVK
jgi:hypothetical protein